MEVAVVDKNDDIEVGNEDQKVKPLETKVAADVPSGPPPFDFFDEDEEFISLPGLHSLKFCPAFAKKCRTLQKVF